MLEPRANEAITRLVTSVLSVKPLMEGLAVPVRVVPVARDTADPPGTWSARRWSGLERLLDRVAGQAGVTGLSLSRGMAVDDLQVFERVISDHLALADVANTVGALPEELPAQAGRVIAASVANGFDVFFRKDTVVARDGVPLNVYGAGPGDETVVLVPACGMPAALTETWMRFLARDRRVLAWESRGLFGPAGQSGDHAVDVTAQAADLFAVMDHYAVSSAHVVGLCGGAVIALAAAAGRPARISSLSLWHGAYEFGSGSPRTRFQDDLIELMAIAAHSRAAARSVQTAFCQVALRTTPAETAHFVLYPYTNPELFYRYCRLNGSIATTDVEPYLTMVEQPTLVVTSEDDETAHPQGSRQVAEGLPNGLLRVEPHGDHSSLFHADTTLMQVAVDFIAEQGHRPAGEPLSIDCPRFV
ncbi:alpha/beta fold hydrolase [Sphaerisporangium aureirubrum]|uniref:Alpha/beta fold hydrolase n=1 Tax=Sphaerisporangium aureirubrum TaxID=1544736 RepID=A0ABW1NLK9_9ACTN